MSVLEDRIRELNIGATLDRSVGDVVERGRLVRRRRRMHVLLVSATAGLVVSLGAAGLGAVVVHDSPSTASGVPFGTQPGWGPHAVGVNSGTLAAATKVCSHGMSLGPLVAATTLGTTPTTLGNGVLLLIYRARAGLWACETTGTAVSGGGVWPYPTEPVDEAHPLADTCSNTITVAQVLGFPVGDHTKYPAQYLVWGRAATHVDGVVVTAGGRSVSAGMADGFFFALVPGPKVDLNAKNGPNPTVTSTAYSASGAVLGHDQRDKLAC